MSETQPKIRQVDGLQAALDLKAPKANAAFTGVTDVQTLRFPDTTTMTTAGGGGGGGEANTASNLSGGEGLFSSKVGVDLRFKSLVAGTGVTFGVAANAITINGSGEANTASNLGAGVGLFASKSAANLQFKSLIAGANITLTPAGDSVTIAATGGGGGGDAYLAATQTFTGINTFTQLSKWGAATTQTGPWDASGAGAGAIFLEVGIGAEGAPTTNAKAGLYVEKWCSNNNGTTYGDVGAAHLKSIKMSGASNLSGATISAYKAGGSGDVIGGHIRATTIVPLAGSPSGSLYGLWVVAQNASPSAGSGHLSGIEVNTLEGYADGGHFDALNGTTPYSVGCWYALHESTYNNTMCIATAPIGPTAAKWHTMLYVGLDTVAPSVGATYNLNEAILIHGGSTGALGYTGLRMANNMPVCIDLSAVTVTTQIAVVIPNNTAYATVNAAGTATVPCIINGVDNVMRFYSGGAGAAFVTSGGTQQLGIDNGDAANPVTMYVDGGIRRVYAGAANSGGSGYKMLRVFN